jgi:hypothetical protein
MKLTSEQLKALQRELNGIGVAVRTTEYSNGMHTVQFENSNAISTNLFEGRVTTDELIAGFQKN